MHFGSLWVHFGSRCGHFGSLLDTLGAPWDHFGGSWVPLGSMFLDFGAIWRPIDCKIRPEANKWPKALCDGHCTSIKIYCMGYSVEVAPQGATEDHWRCKAWFTKL